MHEYDEEQVLEGTEKIEDIAYEAEMAGADVVKVYHDQFEVLEYAIVDNTLIENSAYADEVNDAYWQADAERVADHYWGQ